MENNFNKTHEDQLKFVFPEGRIIKNSLQGTGKKNGSVVDDTTFLFCSDQGEEEDVENWLMGDHHSEDESFPGKVYRISFPKSGLPELPPLPDPARSKSSNDGSNRPMWKITNKGQEYLKKHN